MATNYRSDAESVSMFVDEVPGPRAFEPAEDQWHNAATRQSELQVRSYRLVDSPSIGKFPFRYELHHPESDVDQPRTAQLLTRKLFAGENSNRPLFISMEMGTSVRTGALQCQQQGADDRWYLQYMATDDVADPDNPTPIALLEYAIGEAGWCGARRLMARSDEQSPLTGALRSTGFSAFCREYVYVAPVAPDGDVERVVRIQQNSDVWGIHQLYLQTTPREVQNSEALTSHEWDVDFEGCSRRGWFIASDGIPAAYVRVRTTRKHHRVDAMFVPGTRSLLVTLFGAVFAALRNESPRPVYVSMRGYQQELESVLHEVGFRLETDQLMMVRYTTVSVPARSVEGFELLRTAESNPRRVPSFYVRDAHE